MMNVMTLSAWGQGSLRSHKRALVALLHSWEETCLRKENSAPIHISIINY
ncbi:hypothetical protein T08_16633 [Trichinella sp. T8]|nr:hypothetical protein T08_16633 [Trichinella sp. T8]